MKRFNILVACEESQEIACEFRKLGCNAFSCDLQECSGGHPEFHINGDCVSVIESKRFTTESGESASVDKWDLIIAHPPCTYLATSGNRWFNVERYGQRALDRLNERKQAIDFFMYFTRLSCDHVAIENPIGVMSSVYRKPDQIIHPFQFGHSVRKSTCLWLKNLPKLTPTNIVDEGEILTFPSGKRMSAWFAEQWGKRKEERQRLRSKTFHGIAVAIAKQWYDFLRSKDND